MTPDKPFNKPFSINCCMCTNCKWQSGRTLEIFVDLLLGSGWVYNPLIGKWFCPEHNPARDVFSKPIEVKPINFIESKFKQGVYEHYKGKYYYAFGLAGLSGNETDNEESNASDSIVVLYIPLYPHNGIPIRIRALKEWNEWLGTCWRYKFIGTELKMEQYSGVPLHIEKDDD